MVGLNEYKCIYQESELMCVYVTPSLYIEWANDKAKKNYPVLSKRDGLFLFITEDIIQQLTLFYDNSEVKSTEFESPFSGIRLIFTKTIDGWVVNILAKYEGIELENKFIALSVHNAISSNIRSPLHDILSANHWLYYNHQVLEIDGTSEHIMSTNQGCYDILRAVHLITNYSSFINNTVLPPKEVVNLSKMVFDIVQSINMLVKRKKNAIKIVVDIPNENAYILAVPQHIEMLILELLSNSLKASTEETIIHVLLSITEKSVNLTIADNGWGMSSSITQKACVPFFSHNHSGESFKYMGLGLTLCRFACGYNNATMTISSQIGDGTTVGTQFVKFIKETKENDDILRSTISDSIQDKYSILHVTLSQIFGCPAP